MKVSEIKIEDIAEYIKEEFTELSTAQKTFLSALLAAAKAFIKSHTGIKDLDITGDNIGSGDGKNTKFYLSDYPIIEKSQILYIDGTEAIEETDYSIERVSGEIKFLTAPAKGAAITANYKMGLDAYEDFPIVVYVLIQDMYDTRSLYVEKANLNFLVESTLGAHCLNLI